MFYSQFILAKKGPLGTIWIAAHLERKLRKNQVADTDIGVSVDSILFPEVPIALRLSSHLLLGVVRIYSRKVNYLFHDCSEALLKIKQAFRSTAVDLPPGESTAPYHSITLPETFDLDDFELPDNVFPQGDYVDRHVSAREQITLQDTVSSIGLSTSQFGLDERFGDGDASQIGLDIDEDMFLDKGQHDATLMDLDNVECQTSALPATPFANIELDDCEGGDGDGGFQAANGIEDHGKHIISDIEYPKRSDVSSHMHGYNSQTTDLNEVVFPSENIEGSSAVTAIVPSAPATEVPSTDLLVVAQAPSTPGLVVEAIPASVQEVSALSHQKKMTLSDSWEKTIPDVASSPCLESEDCDPKKLVSKENLEGSCQPDFHEDGNQFGRCLSSNGTSHEFQGHSVPMENGLPSSSVGIASEIADISQVVSPPTSDLFEPESTSVAQQASEANEMSLEPAVLQTCSDEQIEKVEAEHPSSSNIPDQIPCASGHVLQSCSSTLDESNQSIIKDGILVEKNASLLSSRETCRLGLEREVALNSSGTAVEMPGDLELQDMSRCMQSEIESVNNKSADVITAKIIPESLNFSRSSDFPEPERLRAAPVAELVLPNDLLGQSTLEKGHSESDGSVDRISTLSGKKRHSMESTPVLQDGNATKFFRGRRSRKNVDVVPDDDELLSSILVGRRKSRPVPPSLEIVSSKRSRVTKRPSMPKRKVLVDDAMVLHADAIRKQLINTEDIRRVRKKAPCTRDEIWMIEKCFLEDEIFDEPLLTGMSSEIIDIPIRIRILSSIVSRNDRNHSSFGVSNDLEPPQSSDINQEARMEGTGDIVASVPEKSDGGELHPSKETVESETMPGEATSNLPNDDQIPETASMEIDRLENVNDAERNHVVDNGSDMPLSSPHFEPDCGALADSRFESNNGAEALPPDDGLCCNPEQESLIQPFDEVLDDNALHMSDSICVENGGSTLKDSSMMKDPRISSDAGGMVHEYFPRECNVEGGADMQVEDGSANNQLEIAGEDDLVEKFMDGEGDTKENPQFSMEEYITSEVGESSSCQEVIVDTDMSYAKDIGDFGSRIDGNDTEFLIVDDETELNEEADNDIPDAEENHILDNSGWSSRTRNVARFLKTLFDKEANRERKVVPMERLLAGKTRKEASRMFFETLVLKTRDYIHVEQDNPFANINIHPSARLLKSEF
ncbi:Sister chromatid cohesion 1 protein 3 [Acorus calamus]|uniref:Sister chromatid cohesion 1 protein 3 n=1 Tax=Acorus calamus TaxID=4465 RepID=A0AAV9EZQ3_ACOCL|nr:Sister chromatid cohesion 1 protein 3 [Acorus calamus]